MALWWFVSEHVFLHKHISETIHCSMSRYFQDVSRKCFHKFSLQKQPFRGILRKRCSENTQQIYRRTPMSNCDFNKVALHGCSPFYKNTYGRLLQKFVALTTNKFEHTRELFRANKILILYQLNISNNVIFLHDIKMNLSPNVSFQ